jgi:hypothetical protein
MYAWLPFYRTGIVHGRDERGGEQRQLMQDERGKICIQVCISAQKCTILNDIFAHL